MRVYLDTCIVIYLVEDHDTWASTVRIAMGQYPEAEFCLSPLVYLECLVGPLKAGLTALVQNYEMFFAQCVCLEIPSKVYRTAAHLRANHSLKTPDALHLAIAQHHECEVLMTNDNRLRVAAGELAVNVRDI